MRRRAPRGRRAVRQRAERSQRRVLLRHVGGPRGARPHLRRRRTRCAWRETAQRSVDEIEAWLDANGVDAWFTPRRAPDDRDVARTGRRVGVPGCDRERAQRRRAVRRARRRSGAGAVPVAGVPRRTPPTGQRDAAARPVGARAPSSAPCARRADPRVQPRDAVPRRPAGRRRDRHRQRASRARGHRPRRVVGVAACVPPIHRAAGHVHRGHRARARPARRDRLDRRRGTGGLADRPALLPDDARRPYRVRRRRGDGRRRRRPRSAAALRSTVDSQVS